jgi:hypothetical protein
MDLTTAETETLALAKISDGAKALAILIHMIHENYPHELAMLDNRLLASAADVSEKTVERRMKELLDTGTLVELPSGELFLVAGDRSRDWRRAHKE